MHNTFSLQKMDISNYPKGTILIGYRNKSLYKNNNNPGNGSLIFPRLTEVTIEGYFNHFFVLNFGVYRECFSYNSKEFIFIRD